MVSTFGLFVAAVIVSIAVGATTPAIYRTLARYGKTPFIVINPRSRGIQTVWRNAANPGTVSGRDGKPAEIITDPANIHGMGNARAYLVNSLTGSTVRLDGDEGRFEGLDGVSLYMQHRDGRVSDVQNSGRLDLEAIAKWGALGLGFIALCVVAILGILVAGAT